MKNTNENRHKEILECAVELLAQEGAQGMTMRKLANTSGISLGHLQYYFKDKNTLYKATINWYLEEYAQRLLALKPTENMSPDNLEEFFLELLVEGSQSNEAIVIKEFWALSSRSEELREYMTNFYELFQNMLTMFLSYHFSHATSEKINWVATLLLNYFEGYLVTQPNISLPRKEIAQQLSQTISLLLAEEDT